MTRDELREKLSESDRRLAELSERIQEHRANYALVDGVLRIVTTDFAARAAIEAEGNALVFELDTLRAARNLLLSEWAELAPA
jgi:hypothetical protein